MTRITAALIGGALLIAPCVVRAQVAADLPSEHWWVGVDGGWAEKFDDSGLWSTGYAVGVSGYYAMSTTLYAGGRFGVSHWDYYPGTVERNLVPPGAMLTEARSTGQTEMVEFGVFVKAERPALLPFEFGVSALMSVQMNHVKHFAHSEVVYTVPPGNEALAVFEINESFWRPAVMAAVGIGRPLTEQSIIEVLPWYRIVFEGSDVAGIPGVSLEWRVRV